MIDHVKYLVANSILEFINYTNFDNLPQKCLAVPCGARSKDEA